MRGKCPKLHHYYIYIRIYIYIFLNKNNKHKIFGIVNVVGYFTKHRIWGFVQKIGDGALLDQTKLTTVFFFKTSTFPVNEDLLASDFSKNCRLSISIGHGFR